jgi:hypothetical protein
MHLFEYAVIRFVPRVEREEFINVGVILYCPAQRFLHASFALDEPRVRVFAGEADLADLHQRLTAFQRICAGGTPGGPIGQQPAAVRFRWLIAPRSTLIQTSPVHTGLCHDAAETLAKLMGRLVG